MIPERCFFSRPREEGVQSDRLSCREAEPLISRKVDGELSPGLGESLETHLEQCESCRNLARRQESHERTLRQAMTVPPETLRALEEEVAPGLVALRDNPRVSGNRIARSKAILAFAASLLVGVGLWLASPWYAGQPYAGQPYAGRSEPPTAHGDEAVIWVQSKHEDTTLVPGLDGPPRQLRTYREKTIFTDIPPAGEEKKSASELILELERTQNRFVHYPGGWH